MNSPLSRHRNAWWNKSWGSFKKKFTIFYLRSIPKRGIVILLVLLYHCQMIIRLSKISIFIHLSMKIDWNARFIWGWKQIHVSGWTFICWFLKACSTVLQDKKMTPWVETFIVHCVRQVISWRSGRPRISVSCNTLRTLMAQFELDLHAATAITTPVAYKATWATSILIQRQEASWSRWFARADPGPTPSCSDASDTLHCQKDCSFKVQTEELSIVFELFYTLDSA